MPGQGKQVPTLLAQAEYFQHSMGNLVNFVMRCWSILDSFYHCPVPILEASWLKFGFSCFHWRVDTYFDHRLSYQGIVQRMPHADDSNYLNLLSKNNGHRGYDSKKLSFMGDSSPVKTAMPVIFREETVAELKAC